MESVINDFMESGNQNIRVSAKNTNVSHVCVVYRYRAIQIYVTLVARVL